VTVEDDEIVLSTIKGRRKYANMLRDPRVSVLIPDPADAYRYIEVRGTVTMVDEGGDELISALSDKYRGVTPYPGIARGEQRVVVRVHADRVVEYL
jgi:PPOX class probable F420-dependent enzyme